VAVATGRFDLNYTTRKTVVSDIPFLRQLHEASMRPHVERQFGGWDAAFQGQKFSESMSLETQELILVSGRPVGLINRPQTEQDIVLDQLWILPSHQNLGLGTQLIQDLIAISEGCEKPIRLSVLLLNPAVSLYERMGFQIIDQSDTLYKMKRSTPNRSQAQ